MENLRANAARQISGETPDTPLEPLVYPMLGRLITPPGKAELAAQRQKLLATLANLERVQRQGNSADAQKAGVAIRAYEIVLAMLESLEQELQQ